MKDQTALLSLATAVSFKLHAIMGVLQRLWL